VANQTKKEWIPLDSSCVQSYRYDPRGHALGIEYSGGEKYEYFDVSPSELRKMLGAESIGKFVNEKIKRKPFRKIGVASR
jgi:hypothetical protein